MRFASGLALLVVLSSLGTAAQQASQPPAAPTSPTYSGSATSATTAGGTIDPATHAAAVQLVKTIGMSEKMKANLDKFLDDGVEQMRKKLPDIRPEFTNEWHRRMKERLNVDDFAAVAVAVYEKHFTAKELSELDAIQKQVNEGKTPEVPDALKAKLQEQGSALMSEIMGGCSQLGAKLGADIGVEISKEHPEWTPEAKSAPAAK